LFEFIVFGFGLITILSGPVVGHIVGWMVSRHLRSKFGHGRDWMPTLPNNTVTDPDAQKRWEKRARIIEARILKLIESNPVGVEADQLAATLGEDVAVVSAALSRMRDEIPVRLRVTRMGRLLHDFTTEDIKRLRARQGLKMPVRALLFILAIFANIGATWPVLMSVFVAVLGLAAMATSVNPAFIGGAALITTVVIVLGNALAGTIIHLLLTPWGGPRLGSVKSVEDPSAIEEPHQARAVLSHSDSSIGFIPDASGCSVGDIDLDEGIVVVIIGALLVLVIVVLTAAIGVWLRGVWRAIMKIGRVDPILSPASWIRGSKPADWIEKWIPTNDLVLRVVSVLKRLSIRTHPEDGGMVQRVMGIATRNQGRVSSLEIMLAEGLSEDGAMTVGAELVGFLGGEIHVGDHGEVEFIFPKSVLGSTAAAEDDLHAEYLHFQGTTFQRRRAQHPKKLPSNIPGLDYGHLIGTDRLVAGTILMQICAMLLVHTVPGVPLLLQIGVDFIFPMMTLGAFALSGAARYAMSEMARHGVQRDIRRAAFVAVREARAGKVNFGVLADELHARFRPSWRSLKRDHVMKELMGVVVDLDLEPTEHPGEYHVGNILQRKDGLAQQRQEPFVLGLEGEDEVVFSSQVEHERIYAM